ncbi:MAG: BON domain-containing protein [Verrucomicrobiota bacterium]
MKKYSVFCAIVVLGTSLAQSQTPSGQGVTPSGQGATPSGQTSATGKNATTPTQPRGAVSPDDNTRQRVLAERQNRPNFGGTNQHTFGTTNRPFGTTNQVTFGNTNALPFSTTTNRPTGTTDGANNDLNGARGLNGPGTASGLTNQAAGDSDQSFTQGLRTALAKSGSTQIYFPQTRSNITVANQNGVVTLQGTVANAGERQSIEARIKSMGGVTSINNQLQISGQTQPTGTENQRKLLTP